MKGIINFFNIILVPFAIMIGFIYNFQYMWLMFALYSSLMFTTITINTIVSAVIDKRFEENYASFWRTLFVIIASISWTFFVLN